MKTYTQEEFDAIERDKFGIKYCPTGDYSQILSFGERCSFGKCCRFGESCRFGERCSFGECCSFGEWCRFGERCNFEKIGPAKEGYPFAAWIGAGSRPGSKTYFFNLESGIYVRCGCFLGTLGKFREIVRKTHEEDGLAAEYLAVADIIESKLSV